MRRLLVAAMAAALISPVAATTAAAAQSPAVASAALATTAVPARTLPLKSLAEQRTAALAVAARYAAQAPNLSWQQKSRNADDLATRLRLPNIGVAERALAIGKTQLGTTYLYGGSTPRGFDCSGLTQFAFAKAGATLPRTAAQQRRATRVVTSPRVGDLVFIGGRTPYHVGIYVGNNRMLHSPRPGKAVQIATIWTTATYGRV
ncbi:C40 family peptidase [Piscicoccus intestinalis]|uniref:C40 family peptidase n=1 Tax=Piscicoccus intestinalis TaxID=746033 RepID=UPI000A01FD21|nr:C40 family peptidase [Piscicoccus intestinalis]